MELVAGRNQGKWIYDDCDYACSECKRMVYGLFLEILTGQAKYCPFCGAQLIMEES